MAKVKMTVQTLKDRGLWDDVCEQKGWSPWILNEGRIDYDDWVEFDDEFPKLKEETYRYEVRLGYSIFNIVCKSKVDFEDVIKLQEDHYLVYDTDNLNQILWIRHTNIHDIKEEEE